MNSPRVLILRAPGTNCDVETAFAFEQAGGAATPVHINSLLENPSQISDYQILCIPGGFSYGDDVGAGNVLGLQMQSRLSDILHEFHGAGKLILGICNGFQILMKSGLLLSNEMDGPPATLTWNDSGRFYDNWVHLAVDDELCVFLKGVKSLELPVAHAEGKFVGRNNQLLDYLEVNHQLAIKYCKPSGPNGAVPFPFNPNGSERNVAGICDQTGRV
ncbi:MAG: phosphoribosylformylglycinamidine synthase subunit PurQ, partial [Planctomycetota bacterium]